MTRTLLPAAPAVDGYVLRAAPVAVALEPWRLALVAAHMLDSAHRARGVRDVRAEALRVARAAPKVTGDVRAAGLAWADRFDDAMRDVPAADRVAVHVCAIRDLLADAPDACCDLDRTVRDVAAFYGYAPDGRHAALAAGVLAATRAP